MGKRAPKNAIFAQSGLKGIVGPFSFFKKLAGSTKKGVVEAFWETSENQLVCSLQRQ